MKPLELLAPHQQRMIDEHRELRVKIDALAAFTRTDAFIFNLPSEEKSRLSHQLDLMQRYAAVLGERIDAFEPT